MKKNIHFLYRTSFALVIAGLVLMSCSKVAVSSPEDNSSAGTPSSPSTPSSPPVLPNPVQHNGILNGHFDVDTAMAGMPFPRSQGTVTYHVHEYDKINQTTTVDFFNLLNDGGSSPLSNAGDFDHIQTAIPAGKRFYLQVVNAKLNPGGLIEINGQTTSVTDYLAKGQRQTSAAAPTIYTVGEPSGSGDVRLEDLKLAFDSTVNANSILLPTSPEDCVFTNIPGPYNEYRDGALVIQALDVDSMQIDPTTGAATENGGLLWEGIVYNHYMVKDSMGQEEDPGLCYSATFY